MQAMEIHDKKLRLVMLPEPIPKAHEVQIRVAYVGVNRADVMQVAGNYPPPDDASSLPGLEVSGVVSAVGKDVVGWSEGEQVCALLNGGGYAEYVTVPAAQCVPVVKGLRESAALPEAAATSYVALRDEANLQPGERVLLHGGTSGVGIIMAQVAKAWGAEVFATVGSAEKCEILRKLGVVPINHREGPFAEQIMTATKGEGVDVIIDILGGPQFVNHLKLLRRGGRLVSLAMLEGPVVEPMKLSPILLKTLRISGAMLRSRTAAEKVAIMQGVRQDIWPHVASGAVQPFIDTVFPLAEAEKALSRMEERLHLGKILLEVR